MIDKSGTDQPLEEVLQKLERALVILEQEGVRINHQSRFRIIESEFRKITMAKEGIILPTELNWEILSQGICDIMELYTIVTCKELLRQHPRELNDIVNGHVLSYEGTDSMPRNLQFQLYLSSIISLAGFPITLCEPDLILTCDGSEYAVAVKRINSMNKLKQRISEAKNQIIRTGKKGFVALGLEQIAREQSKSIVALAPDYLWEAGDTLTHPVIDVKLKEIIRNNLDPNVIGYFVCIMIPAILPANYSIGFTSTFRALAVALPGHECHEVSLEICKKVSNWNQFLEGIHGK